MDGIGGAVGRRGGADGTDIRGGVVGEGRVGGWESGMDCRWWAGPRSYPSTKLRTCFELPQHERPHPGRRIHPHPSPLPSRERGLDPRSPSHGFRLGGGDGVAGLILGEGLGVLDEAGGLVDEALGVLYRLAPAGIKASAVQGRLSLEVPGLQAAH